MSRANDAANKASGAVSRANDAAARVSQAETAEHGTVERVKKIEQSSLAMNSKIKQIQIKTDSGFKAFDSNVKDMKEESATLALYYNARGGERSALSALIQLAKQGGGRKGTLVKSLLDDSNLYFRDYKYSLNQQYIVDKATRKRYRPAAEQLYEMIYKNESPLMREAAANDISDRKLDYLVQDPSKGNPDDPNLKVACRTRAIETLTGEFFEDYPPYSEVESWWLKTGSREKKYSNSLHRLHEVPTQIANEDTEKFIAFFEEVLDSRDGMCITQFNIGKLYLNIGDRKRAKQHLKKASEQCDNQIGAMYRYALVLYDEGKKDEVIDILSKMKPWVKDKEIFVKFYLSSFPNIANEKKAKTLFEVK